MSIQLNVEVQDAQIILSALAELPLKHSLDTWFKVKSQAEQQVAAQQQGAEGSDQAPETPAGANGGTEA